MKKVRIVERTLVDDRKVYIIQQRHFLFRWCWVAAWVNSLYGAWCGDSFSTLEDAQNHLCYFDGSTYTDRVIVEMTVPTGNKHRRSTNLDI